MKCLVTGVAGFIGSHIAERLIKEGHEVYGIDDMSAGYRKNLPEGVKFLMADITNKAHMDWFFKDHEIDVIFHNAASKKTVCLEDPLRDTEVNAKGTLRLLGYAQLQGCKFIHASTGSVYGEAVIQPQSEIHPTNPTSFYGVSKLAGEKYVQMFHEQFGLDTTILRYFHVYGERQEDNEFGGVVAIFKKAHAMNMPIIIYGDGTQQRSFTHVDDVVEANIASMINPIAKGQIYNCASGLNYTVHELAIMIGIPEAHISFKDWVIGDIKVFDIDNSNIKHDLTMEFKSLEDGLWA